MTDAKSVLDDVEMELGKSTSSGNSDLDFDLDEADLNRMQNEEPSASSAAEESSFSFDTAAEDSKEPFVSDDEVKGKSKINLIIIVGVLVGLIVLGAFGYFAMQVLGGNGKSSMPRASNGIEQGVDFSSADTNQSNDFAAANDGVGNNFSVPSADADKLAAALGVSQAPQDVTQQSRQENVEPQPVRQDDATKLDDIVITQGIIETPAPLTEESQTLASSTNASRISEEERLYDNLLSSVEGMDVPPEAIKIDQNVINRRLENQRIATLEQEIKEARSSMAGIQGAVESIRTQVGGFAQVLEKNATDQAGLNESIAKLTQEVEQLSAAQEKELKAIKTEVASAKRSADQAVANAGEAKRAAQSQPRVVTQPAPTSTPAPAPAAQPAPVQVAVRQPVAAPEPVRQPQVQAPVTETVAPTKVFEETRSPATVQVAAQAPAAGSNMPAHCDGSRVSANWRVKGVNSHSAYVVRTQDQQGMYLKAGVDVPGYGQVQAFDATNRAVCTTNGLIRR